MDIKIVGDEAKTPNVEKTPETISTPVYPDLMERQIAEMMGIDDTAEIKRSSDKIQTLLEYAKSQTTDHSPENLKWAIRSLELKLGTPPFGEKRINYVARYAYLMGEKRKLDAELKSFTDL